MREKIVVITPMYNEGGYIEHVINSVLRQSVKPCMWIIVNDNSTDNSVELVQKYSTNNLWIKLIDSNLQMSENYGPKIVSVRTVGYNYIVDNDIEFDYLAHLDADIVLCDSYFEDVLNAFAQDEKLGICAGKLKLVDETIEITRSIYVRDGNRVLKKGLLSKIGYQKYMWLHDSSDKMQALYNGWNVYSIDNLSTHLRPTGNKLKLKYCYAMGQDTNRFGYNFLSAFFKSIRYLNRKPFIIAWVAYCFGFFSGYQKTKYYSNEFNRFVSRFYLKDILDSIRIIKRIK